MSNLACYDWTVWFRAKGYKYIWFTIRWIQSFAETTTGQYELSRISTLELYCLHSAILWEAQIPPEDMTAIFQKLVHIFDSLDETLLLWLSRYLVVIEMSHAGLLKLKDFPRRLMELEAEVYLENVKKDDVDTAILRALVSFDLLYYYSIEEPQRVQ